MSLLQGITLAPERRTGILRSLGPITQALLMVMEDKFFDKLRSAMSHSLQMLTMATEIINCLREANHLGNVSGVLKELADVLILTAASRSTQKIYFPILLFKYIWKKRGKIQISFSGAEMIKKYTDISVIDKIIFTMKSGADPIKTSQVVFHAMFGTNIENLNILKHITNNKKWRTRKELNTSVYAKVEKR